MRSLLSRSKGADLPERLDALRTISERADGRLETEDAGVVRTLLERAGERMGHGAGWTVVALAGATGSGKSSIFNSLAGAELSQVGVRRPTTGVSHAAVWSSDPPLELLDWLGVPRRHNIDDPELQGLVLLDLPDHDSTETAHRLEVDRLADLVDIFVWVVDPQKYADAALHEGYLRPLASHAAVTAVVLNQADRLTEADRGRCLADISKLLDQDGLRRVRVLSTSALSGEGMGELRSLIEERVREERAALDRLTADVDRVRDRLTRYCDGNAAEISSTGKRRLTASLAGAAGVDVITDAVARAHRRDAALAAGWPLTRWLRRFRPDPLARLHLRSTGGSPARTSLSEPTQLQRAEVETAIRSVSRDATEGLAAPWPDTVRRRVEGSVEALVGDLDRAVARTDLGAEKRPRWWAVAGALQMLLAIAAAIGFLWLTVLFVLEWFQVPRPPTPETEGWPWPTLLLVGGLAGGFLASVVAGQIARWGARRRARRARTKLVREISRVADDRVVGPITDELAARREICEALASLQNNR